MSRADEISTENLMQILKVGNENSFILKCTYEGNETNLKDLLEESWQNTHFA